MKTFIIVILTIFILNTYNKNNIEPVFNEDGYEYSMYILEFSNQNISTNNIEEIFENMKIIWVEPLINLVYKDKLNYKLYYFEDISTKENIKRFKNNFITKLQNNNYKNDAINYQILGIKINRMKVYSNEQDIINLDIEGLKYKKIE